LRSGVGGLGIGPWDNWDGRGRPFRCRRRHGL